MDKCPNERVHALINSDKMAVFVCPDCGESNVTQEEEDEDLYRFSDPPAPEMV